MRLVGPALRTGTPRLWLFGEPAGGQILKTGWVQRRVRQEAAKPATEVSRKSSVEREGGIKWVGGLFNRPGDAFVPLTWEAINGLHGDRAPNEGERAHRYSRARP